MKHEAKKTDFEMDPQWGRFYHFLPYFAVLALTLSNVVYHWRYASLYVHERVVHHQNSHGTIDKSDGQTISPKTFLPKCPLPKPNLEIEILYNFSASWASDFDYYADLARENSDMAARVRNLTRGPANYKEDEQGKIPHRLVFTHRNNLFDCSDSTSPMLYNLAENAKATVNAYARIWDDLEYVFLTDEDCVTALEMVQPALVTWFLNSMLRGMYKADLCRAAYLFLHGGYYFDVDVLVVRPFVAPKDANFVTVKGDGFPANGFFQAFLAAERNNTIIRTSLDMMLHSLNRNGPNGKYLGPISLMEAWRVQAEGMHNATNAKSTETSNGPYLLTEVNLMDSQSTHLYGKLATVLNTTNFLDMLQHVPIHHGDQCQFSAGACNVVVLDESDETLYFYSRILGTTWCGKKIRNNCTTHGLLLERLRLQSKGT